MQSAPQGSPLALPLEWWAAPTAPETPDAYNVVAVRRFRAPGAGLPAAVLILNPGFTGGVNVLDYLAEEVTAAAAGRLEVWSTERRNNRLEDPLGMELAEAAGDPSVALEYYFPVEPAPAPLPPDAGPRLRSQQEAACVQHWGLAVALADLRVVVRRARTVVGDGKLFLGGHSLGGMLAQCYAAWEFPEGPGHCEIDGIVLIDGAVGGPEWTRSTGLAQYAADLEAIHSGEFYWDDPVKGATPRFGILGQVAAMAAVLPDWRDRPSLVAPLVPELLPVPSGITLTNEAFLGLAIDADTSPIPHYRAHVGRLDAPPTSHRSSLSPRHWLGCRETGELTDLRRIAGALRQRGGSNGVEWYASRLLNAEVDLSSNLDSRHADSAALAARHQLRLWHHGEEAASVFGVVTDSSQQKRERYQWYAATVATGDVTLLHAPEQEHLDPLFAV